MTASRPIRIGIIGLGLIAQAVHLQNLHRLREKFEVVHVCDLSATLAAQIASEWGIARSSSDADTLLADPNVDAVLLLTPGTHAELARRALAAGKHVLAEKPLAHTIAECRMLEQLAAETDRVLQVGYMKMYDPILVRARAELAGIGDIRLVRVTVLHPDDDPQYAHQRYLRASDVAPEAAASAVRYELARLDEALGEVGEPFRSIYSDVLQGSACHELALLRGLFGEQELSIRSAQIGTGGPGHKLSEPPQIQALGRLGRSQFSLSWNWVPAYPEYFEEVAVWGSDGRLRLSMPGPYLRDHRAELTVERTVGSESSTQRLLSGHDTAFVSELVSFHDAISLGAPVLSTAAGAAWDVAVMQALTTALAEGYNVRVGGEAAEAGT